MPEKDTNSNVPNLGNQDFLATLEEKLLGQVGAVSSEPSKMEDFLAESVKDVETARGKYESGIGASFERKRIETQETGERTLSSALESRRGFGTNTALIKQIKDDTEKSLRDLDLREQEALAIGAIEDADKIRNLKFQTLQFEQQSKQQAFSNILATMGIGLQTESFKIQKETQEFKLVSDRINFLRENNLLEKASEEDKRVFEAQMGIPTGTLDTIKPNEPLNLQTVAGVGLVNVTRDKNGKPKIDILARSIDEKSPTERFVERTTNLTTFLGGKAGSDGFVAPETYEQASRMYVNQGGTIADFKKEFPPQYYLSSGSMSYVSENLRAEAKTDLASALKSLAGGE